MAIMRLISFFVTPVLKILNVVSDWKQYLVKISINVQLW